ncbi:MAG TPA: DUF885 domain-containing protein [Gemmatimonadales bacterium]|jgi:uncharacterized protein (DUF885 family)|nr:DUF885 domain-containing protein [Gemmatimonadales bacterium]
MLLTLAVALLASSSAQQQSDSARLRQLFAQNWEYTMREYPEFATAVGYPGQNARWTDNSLEAIARRKRELNDPLNTLRTIDRAKLSPTDQLNYDLFRRNYTDALEETRFPGEFMPITQMGGVQQDVPSTIAQMPAGSVREYEDIIARLRGVPVLVSQTMVLLERGLAQGLTPPRITLRDVPGQAQNLVVDDPLTSPLLKAFTRFPAAVPDAEQQRLHAAAVAAYRDSVAPAFRRLSAYLRDKYVPRARTTTGMRDLPNGMAWYQVRARASTTTDLTPAQIHAIGLAEVKRIRGQMDSVIAAGGFTGSFAEFVQLLRTDPRFYWTTSEDLIRGSRELMKRIDPELTKLFGTLPRLTYGVSPIPSYAERSQTTAYYQPGSPLAHRAGTYFVNTYNLPARPKWEMEALSLHEAVPGHHLQIALAQELEGVPEFRRFGGYTAFVEGWGLYSESLGGELGLYTDPYSKFGQLTYEMWRAIRLVIDTGIHTMGWTREQAIDYFKANAAKTEHDITVEVDRYIVWPGQALAYKIGELKIKELRAYATSTLGSRFDIRAFHDQVLGAGAVPLDVLEARIRAWVASVR